MGVNGYDRSSRRRARAERRQKLDFDAYDPIAYHPQLARRGMREVQHSSSGGRATIVDADLDSPAVLQIGHQGVYTQGSRPMRSGQLATIIDLPTRGALSVPLAAIPRSQAVLDVAAGGGPSRGGLGWVTRGWDRGRAGLTRTGRQQPGD